MNSNRPNFFSYATNERSQDALICWLLDWADESKGGSSEDKELRDCGRRFVKALLNHRRGHERSIELKGGSKVKILQQVHTFGVRSRIDVLARIEDMHVLLIEDKIDTMDRDGQLKKYYNHVENGKTQFDKVKPENLYPVYIKTGNQPLKDDRRIEGIKNYKVFNRKDFLDVLDGYKGCNAILRDFRKHLQGMEDQTNSYLEWTRKDDKRSWRSWEGFYRHLESKLINAESHWSWWGHVPLGDFPGFSWGPSDRDKLYLQIEARLQPENPTDVRLCFKVYAKGIPNGERNAFRDDWNRRVLKASGGKAVTPPRMGIGKTMTVAWWQPDWMAFGKDGKLDMSGTVENLKPPGSVVIAAMSSS